MSRRGITGTIARVGAFRSRGASLFPGALLFAVLSLVAVAWPLSAAPPAGSSVLWARSTHRLYTDAEKKFCATKVCIEAGENTCACRAWSREKLAYPDQHNACQPVALKRARTLFRACLQQVAATDPTTADEDTTEPPSVDDGEVAPVPPGGDGKDAAQEPGQADEPVDGLGGQPRPGEAVLPAHVDPALKTAEIKRDKKKPPRPGAKDGRKERRAARDARRPETVAAFSRAAVKALLEQRTREQPPEERGEIAGRGLAPRAPGRIAPAAVPEDDGSAPAASTRATRQSTAPLPERAAMEDPVAALVAVQSRGLLMSKLCARLEFLSREGGPALECHGGSGVAVIWLSGVPYLEGEWALAPEVPHLRTSYVKLAVLAEELVDEAREWEPLFGPHAIRIDVRGSASAQDLSCAGLRRGGGGAVAPAPTCGDGRRPCLRAGRAFEYLGASFTCRDDPPSDEAWTRGGDGQRYASQILADLRARRVLEIFDEACGAGQACPFALRLLRSAPVLPGTWSGEAAARARNVTIIVSVHAAS